MTIDIYGIKEGSANITVSADNASQIRIPVYVFEDTYKEIKYKSYICETYKKINLGEPKQNLLKILNPEGLENLSFRTEENRLELDYSEETNILAIESLKAVKETIVISADDVMDEYVKIHIHDFVKLSKTEVTVKIGETVTVQIENYEDIGSIDFGLYPLSIYGSLEYNSLNGEILITGLREGTTDLMVKAKYDDESAYIKVNVISTQIFFSMSTVKVSMRWNQNPVTFSIWNKIEPRSTRVEVENENIVAATVNGREITVNGVSKGETTLTAYSSNLTQNTIKIYVDEIIRLDYLNNDVIWVDSEKLPDPNSISIKNYQYLEDVTFKMDNDFVSAELDDETGRIIDSTSWMIAGTSTLTVSAKGYLDGTVPIKVKTKIDMPTDAIILDSYESAEFVIENFEVLGEITFETDANSNNLDFNYDNTTGKVIVTQTHYGHSGTFKVHAEFGRTFEIEVKVPW